MKKRAKEKTPSFEDAVVEIDYSSCNGYIFWLICIIIGLLLGSYYTDSSFLQYAHLNYSRDPFSPFKSITIRQVETNTLQVNLSYKFLFNQTYDNLLKHVKLVITNGGFNCTQDFNSANNKKTSRDSASFTFTPPFHGTIYAILMFNNKPLSKYFKFSIEAPRNTQSTIYCSQNGSLHQCIFSNVCVKDRRIITSLNTVPQQNFDFLRYDIQSRMDFHSSLERSRMDEYPHRIAFVHDKGDMYLTLKHFFRQCNEKNAQKTLVFDDNKLIEKMRLDEKLEVAFVDKTQQCYRRLILSDAEADVDTVKYQLRRPRQRISEILVLKTRGTIKEVDVLIDSILDFCVRCEIRYATKEMSAHQLLSMSSEPQFIIGVQTDAMIASIFMNATLVNIVPKGLTCGNWVNEASFDGLRAVEVYPAEKPVDCESMMCNDRRCSDNLHKEFVVNADLVGSALGKIFRGNCPPATIKVDSLNNTIILEKGDCE